MNSPAVPGTRAPLARLQAYARSSQGTGTKVVARWSALIAVALWALFQGFWNLGGANLTTDEPVYLNAGLQYIHGDFSANREHPPTAKYILGAAQVLLGHGALSGRICASLLVFVTGVVIFIWFRKETGWWTALVATSFWWLLPREVGGSGIKFDRFAVLEPFMVCFAILAFAACWAWYRTVRWWWGAAGGALMALSVTSKVSTALLVPCFLVLVAAVPGWRAKLSGAGSFIIAFAVVFVGVYLPMGIRSAITYMVQFQAAHNANGHAIFVGGTLTAHPPWWTNLWFNLLGFGPWLIVVVGVLAMIGFFGRPRVLALYIGSALALLLVFYLGLTRIALPSYYYAWVWCLFLLAALGCRVFVVVARRLHDRSGSRWPQIAVVILLAASGCVTATSAASVSISVAQEHPTGLARIPAELAAAGIHGKVLATGLATFETTGYLGNRAKFLPAHGHVQAIVVGNDSRYPPAKSVSRFIAANADHLVTHNYDGITLYIANDRILLSGHRLSFDIPAT